MKSPNKSWSVDRFVSTEPGLTKNPFRQRPSFAVFPAALAACSGRASVLAGRLYVGGLDLEDDRAKTVRAGADRHTGVFVPPLALSLVVERLRAGDVGEGENVLPDRPPG